MARVQTIPDSPQRQITVVCTLPPPHTGQTAVSQRVVGHFRDTAEVRLFNWSGGNHSVGWRWRVSKAVRSLVSVIWIATRSRRNGECIYSVANDGIGLWYNAAGALAARLRGFPLVYHHHSFAYLRRHDARMKRLVRIAGPSATHLVLGPEMAAAFCEQYPGDHSVAIAANYFMLDHPANAETEPSKSQWRGDRVLRLGHLSNLSFDKGIGRVLDVLEALRGLNLSVELHLAGPSRDPKVLARIEDAVRRHNGVVRWWGPVYDDEKTKFFRHIDLFLFPTLYPTEAQPLVIIEALQSGNPVLSYARACIGSLLADGGGILVDETEDFVQPAIEYVTRCLDDPAFYEQQHQKTLRRAKQFQDQADESLQVIRRACRL